MPVPVPDVVVAATVAGAVYTILELKGTVGKSLGSTSHTRSYSLIQSVSSYISCVGPVSVMLYSSSTSRQSVYVAKAEYTEALTAARVVVVGVGQE